MKSEDWLTPAAAARRLGLQTRDLYRLIDRAEIPAYKFGRTVRLRTADVEEYRRRRDDG